MQLAIIHYHLNRGGVTQAVLNHLHALATAPAEQRPTRVAVLYSGQRSGWPESVWPKGETVPFEVTLLEVPELEYDSTIASCEPTELADAVTAALTSANFSAAETLLHVHNHSLGKKASLPAALRQLAGQGYRLLLQVHDFAEDFRPANYRHLMRATRSTSPEQLAATLYPSGDGIHYSVLNGRDHSLLQGAGVGDVRLETLPNAVLPFHGRPPRDEARERVLARLDQKSNTRLVVYPVRGIRRKNVGEMLLHSALAGEASCYAITLAPTNPVEVPPFVRWAELAEELSINCHFDIGGMGVDFLDALAAADALITTSVAEGFGMVFLESWLAGGVLVGRDLPEITADFRSAGVRFDFLSPELLVPTNWIDTQSLASHIHELHRWTCQDYGLGELAADETVPIDAETIDFASLPARYQGDVIRHVVANHDAARQAIIELNPGLSAQLEARSEDHRTVIEDNADRVRAEYSPAAIGKRLVDAYAALAEESPGKAASLPDGRSILDYFLTLERLRPVRLET